MSGNEQERRLAKTPDMRLLNLLEKGYSQPPKIAEAIVEDARQCFQGSGEHLGLGQMRVILVKRNAAHGRPLKETEKVEVVWTIDAGKEDRSVVGPGRRQKLRRQRIRRLLDEALVQGAVATQEDLAEVLQVSVRTIKRDCGQLKAQGVDVPTRGNLKGIGRGQTHKAQIVARWLSGETYDQITLHTRHGLSSVQRYVQTCKQVYNLQEAGFEQGEIALLLQISRALVTQYQEVCRQNDTSLARKRLKEQQERLKRGIVAEKKGAK